MIDKGANPFIKRCDDNTEYDLWSVSNSNLNNLPQSKSIYFPIVNFNNKTLLGPWQYKNGVFPGQFICLIGSGGEGYAIEGLWNKIKAAFKFVKIGKREMSTYLDVALDDMEKKVE